LAWSCRIWLDEDHIQATCVSATMPEAVGLVQICTRIK
jgi:hypothetical protein